MIEIAGIEVLGLPRSPQWAGVRAEFLRGKRCECCGRTDNMNAHHIKPFHLFPELELEPTNLMALCEGGPWNCHYLVGHAGRSWSCYVPDPQKAIRRAAAVYRSISAMAKFEVKP